MTQPSKPLIRRHGRILLVTVTLSLAGCHSVGPLGCSLASVPHAPAVRDAGVPAVALGKADDVPRAKLLPPAEAQVALTGATGPTAAPASTPPVIPPPALEQPISLSDALTLGGVANPTIALAEEAVRASEAELLQARAMLLPTLNAGANVRVHQGHLQGSAGIIRDVNIRSLYAGAGAGAITAGTPDVPGVRIISHLGDAWLAPQAAEQHVISRQFDAVAVRHRTLLEVGTAYLAVVAAHGRLEAIRRSQEDLGKVVQATANFARTGEGRESDAERARTEWLLLERQAEQAQEDVAVAAAELSRLLDLDPSVRLQPADAVPPLLELVNADVPLCDLVQIALANRPELAARGADVAYAQIRVRQERVRPWLPILSAGFSFGGFGGNGTQAVPSAWTGDARMDFDVAAVWTLQNLLAGNRARQNQAAAVVGEMEAERLRTVNLVRDEVGEAYTLVRARGREVEIARRRIEVTLRAFTEDLSRTRNLEGRPIEVTRSVDLLTTARQDLVRAMAGYSEAQLRLFTALGNPPGAIRPRE